MYRIFDVSMGSNESSNLWENEYIRFCISGRKKTSASYEHTVHKHAYSNFLVHIAWTWVDDSYQCFQQYQRGVSSKRTKPIFSPTHTMARPQFITQFHQERVGHDMYYRPRSRWPRSSHRTHSHKHPHKYDRDIKNFNLGLSLSGSHGKHSVICNDNVWWVVFRSSTRKRAFLTLY